MDNIYNIVGKRKMIEVKCMQCAETCEVPAPPGDFLIEYLCASPDCLRQRQMIRPYVPNENDDALYWLTELPNGSKVQIKVGCDYDPFSLAIYRCLGVPHTATTEEILDAYQHKRLALNPPNDPNRCAENAEETAEVDEAYKILSDPKRRRNYNKYGLTRNLILTEEGAGFQDLSGVLNHMFGDGNFYPIIGEPLRLPQRSQRDAPLNNNREENEICHVAAVLIEKLGRYHPDNEDDFRRAITVEADQLRRHRNGSRILHTVGNVYSLLGNVYAVTFSDSDRFYKLLTLYGFVWKYIFHWGDFGFEAVITGANVKYAIGEHREYLAKRWRLVSRRQQLVENILIALNDWSWMTCMAEFEVRIVKACELLFLGGRQNHAMLAQKAKGLQIIGEIYQNQMI